MTTLIEITDYPELFSDGEPLGDRPLLVETGTLIVVRGESGAGKTRLLRRLLDLDPVPLGRLRLRDRDVHEIPGPELRRRLGFLPQDPVRFPITGREMLERVRGFSGNESRCVAQEVVADWLDRLDVTGLLDRPLQELSGGECRRLAFVTMLQLAPEALLLDEPTSGLDAKRVAAVVEVIQERMQAGCAVIWVSHEDTPRAFERAPEYEVRKL